MIRSLADSRLGDDVPPGPLVLDTNVFINALAGRGPPVLRMLLADLSRMFVAAPAGAELSWIRGRMDPEHPGTRQVIERYENLLAQIDPRKVLIPDDAAWRAAGELAGRAARAVVGGGRKIATAFDRVELISDALTAVLANEVGFSIVTEDTDFDVFARLLPRLKIIFYDRQAPKPTANGGPHDR